MFDDNMYWLPLAQVDESEEFIGNPSQFNHFFPRATFGMQFRPPSGCPNYIATINVRHIPTMPTVNPIEMQSSVDVRAIFIPQRRTHSNNLQSLSNRSQSSSSTWQVHEPWWTHRSHRLWPDWGLREVESHRLGWPKEAPTARTVSGSQLQKKCQTSGKTSAVCENMRKYVKIWEIKRCTSCGASITSLLLTIKLTCEWVLQQFMQEQSDSNETWGTQSFTSQYWTPTLWLSKWLSALHLKDISQKILWQVLSHFATEMLATDPLHSNHWVDNFRHYDYHILSLGPLASVGDDFVLLNWENKKTQLKIAVSPSLHRCHGCCLWCLHPKALGIFEMVWKPVNTCSPKCKDKSEEDETEAPIFAFFL